MNYEEALEFYKQQNLDLDTINQLLSNGTLTHNQYRALETIASTMTGAQYNNTPQVDIEPSGTLHDIDDIYLLLFKIENHTHTIKKIIQFVFILSLISAFIVFYTLSTNK